MKTVFPAARRSLKKQAAIWRLGPLEVAAERRVGDVVVGGELPQGLAGRPASNQLLVGNEPAQSTPALHGRKSSRLPHHQRTSPQTAACQAAEQRGFLEVGSRSLGVGSGVGVRRVATRAVRAERWSRDGAGDVTALASIPLFM